MNLITPLQNCEHTVIKLIRSLNAKITETTLREDLQTHPDYPSLLSISDTLNTYNIENIALKTRVDNFSQFPVPFIAHIRDTHTHDQIFTLIHRVTAGKILYEIPGKNKLAEEKEDEFIHRFSGHVLLLDGSEARAEKNYPAKKKKEKRRQFFNVFALSAIPAITLLYIISLFIQYSFSTILSPILFLALTLAGSIVSFLLLLFEIDTHNPVLKDICQAGKKLNCSAVLQSTASGIMGISWSSIGFCYFSGMLLSLLTLGAGNAGVLLLTGSLALLALPYTLFSVYYQWRIVRQWCVLCLAVQAILLLQFVVALTGCFFDHPISALSFSECFITVFFFILPAVGLYISLPALKESKNGKTHYAALQRLKHNRQVFEALLSRQKTVQHSANGLGILLGNPDATWQVIKVCNPYCGPCARAHPVLEELLHTNSGVSLQIIFTATGEDADPGTAPVQHFLAIAQQHDEAITRQALDDWYNPPEKDYTAFAKKYPVDDKVQFEQKEKIQSMKAWCDAMQISFTPTLFINGHQLPEIYNITDLKYFLTI